MCTRINTIFFLNKKKVYYVCKLLFNLKRMTPYEIFFILFFFVLVIVGFLILYKSFEYHKNLSSKTITRGMNGSQGKTVNLTCPSGQKIKTYKANYICTSASPYETQSCDPFWSTEGQLTNFFNPSNTLDISSQISSQCDGKETCSWTVPSGSSVGICQQKTSGSSNGSPCIGKLQLVGTYDCVQN